MNTLTFWLTTTAVIAVAGVALLILVRIGIARQERARSLVIRPRGLSATLTRRLLDLHATSPDSAGQDRDQNEQTASTRCRNVGTP